MGGRNHDGQGDGSWQRAAGRMVARYVILLVAAAACVLATGVFIMACKWLAALL